MYYVFENNNTVEVCVNLTFPQTDIEDEEVTVAVFHDSTSEYLPQNPILASELLCDTAVFIMHNSANI